MVVAIFLDHASTSPLRGSAKGALDAALTELGNPSSVHGHGQHTREILEQARDDLARAIGANRAEIIFNSGGTESNNQAIKGIWWQRIAEDPSRKVIVSASTEHHALIDPIEWLVTHEGAELINLSVSKTGAVDLEPLEQVVAERGAEIALISLMWVNNETGVITDVARVCEIAKRAGIPVHSDAVAALGHVPIDFAASGLTAMSISGHKVGAPIGIGALVVARSFKPESLLHGGGQERGLRSGTMNYPLAASFAAAAGEAILEMPERQARLEEYRNRIESEICESFPEVIVTAAGGERVEHNAHLIFPGALSDNLLFLLDQQGVSVSAGSACQAGVLGPSHVLLGMGYEQDLASSCLRITMGHTTAESDVTELMAAIKSVYPKALSASP